MKGTQSFHICTLILLICPTFARSFQLDPCSKASHYAETGTRQDFICYLPRNVTRKRVIWLYRSYDDTEMMVSTNGDYEIDDSKTGSTLTIKRVKDDHVGEYSCKNGDLLISKFHLCLKSAPKISQPPEGQVTNFTRREGDTVSMWCNISELSTGTIEWFIHDETNRLKINVYGPKLEVRQISRDCPLHYECQATNGFSQERDTRQFNVLIEYFDKVQVSATQAYNLDDPFIPLVLQKDPKDINQKLVKLKFPEKGPLYFKLYCMAESYPRPRRVTWYGNDTKLAEVSFDDPRPCSAPVKDNMDGFLSSHCENDGLIISITMESGKARAASMVYQCDIEYKYTVINLDMKKEDRIRVTT